MKTRREKINAIIEILCEATNVKSDCISRVTFIYQHMIKCYFQPNMHTDSWDLTIINNYNEVRRYMDANLKLYIESNMNKIHKRALREALKEMNSLKKNSVKISNTDFQSFISIWSLDDILSKDFLSKFFRSVPASNNPYYDKKYIGQYV